MAFADQKGGYDVGIFVDQNAVSAHTCSICRCVFKEPMNIGCNEGHVFCKQCLDELFKHNVRMRCPLDQQTVYKRNMSPNKYAERLVNSFRVVCPLQYEQNDDDDAKAECEWRGSLSDMHTHIRQQCGLFVMQCQHCGINKQRKEINDHVKNCDERLVLCPLHCSQSIKQRLLSRHIDLECSMTLLNCDECKENVLRKDLRRHHETACQERLCKCPFADYGCSQLVKAKNLQAHVAQNEVKHLQFQVDHLQQEVKKVRDENHRKMNGPSKLLFLLKNKKAYIYDMMVREKKEINAVPITNGNLHRVCMGQNISFSSLGQSLLESKHVDFCARNNVLFGVSRNADKISALCMKTMTTKTFVSEPFACCYTPIWTQSKGLLLVGGEDPNKSIGKKCIHQIAFNGANTDLVKLFPLPYFTACASCLTINEKLFICGGWWNGNLSTCCAYDLNGTQTFTTTIKEMNHKHQCGGICEWKERGNKMIVAAGTNGNKFVEEYDCVKNMWMDLPRLNEKHETYPALLPSSNLLFCIGGVKSSDADLGCVELYDSRDSANKWIFIDHVEKYFDLPKSKGAGFNCFLPI